MGCIRLDLLKNPTSKLRVLKNNATPKKLQAGFEWEILFRGTNYYPFGFAMPDRNITSEKSRFGFNGKEKDQDGEFGDLSHYDYGFRIYNPAIGRFLSVDPLTTFYPHNSPYVFAENDVIRSIDLDGLEKYIVTFRSFIPQPKLNNPNPFGTSKSFKGDNRVYFDSKSTDYRTEQKVHVDFDLGKAYSLNNSASGTTGYDSDNNVVEESSSTKAGTIRNTKGFNENSDAITFYFNVDAKNKLVNGAPAINANFELSLNPQKDGSFNYLLEGNKDGFPAYELFIKDIDNNKSYLLLNTNPLESGKSPFSLFPPSEENFKLEGNSSNLKEGSKFKFSEKKNTKED